MNQYPLSKVLFPAVLVASAIFSTLTLPLAFIRSESVVIDLRPFYSGEIPPLFSSRYKEVVIPYVGFAIVVSVGTGVAYVEVSRRWQAYQKASQAEKNSSYSKPNLPEHEGEDSETVEYRPSVQSLSFSFEEPIDSMQSPNTLDSTSITALESDNGFNELHNSVPITEFKNSQSLNAFREIIELDSEHRSCRIKIPGTHQSLFAICVEGKYYSFLQMIGSREEAIAIIPLLNITYQNIILIKSVAGFTLWKLEPDSSEV